MKKPALEMGQGALSLLYPVPFLPLTLFTLRLAMGLKERFGLFSSQRQPEKRALTCCFGWDLNLLCLPIRIRKPCND